MSSSPPMPPSEPPRPGDQASDGDPTQAYPSQGSAPQGEGAAQAAERKRNRWVLPVVVVLVVILGVVAGVLASENKSKSPSTVINQHSSTTANNVSVTVPPRQPAQTETVTAPAQTVTAPAKTVTAPAQTVTTPLQPGTPPTTTATGATSSGATP
jgi:hypothetical protein